MPIVTFEDNRYPSEEGESVLRTLERHGVEIPSSCRSGVCQSCLMKCDGGDLPSDAQRGLKETLAAQGAFLSCSCIPESDLTVSRFDGHGAKVSGTIHSIEPLTESVLDVRVKVDGPVSYFPGQFMNLMKADGLVRSYSVANAAPDESLVEFHIGIMPDGKMSGWLANDAQPGDPVDLLGPQGSCFYTSGDVEQPLLLFGTGTGLAPLYGILRDALRQGHTGPIALYHGSLRESGLYLVDTLKDLVSQHDNVTYTPCVLEGEPSDPAIHVGNMMDVVMEQHTDFKGWRVFLCGAPEMVKLMQRKTFMAGASMNAIHTDAFIPAAMPTA
jgi:CDP-4-dehydro-6-deoxyglucose reductase, E3